MGRCPRTFELRINRVGQYDPRHAFRGAGRLAPHRLRTAQPPVGAIAALSHGSIDSNAAVRLQAAPPDAHSSFRAISAEASSSDRFFVEYDAFSSSFTKNCMAAVVSARGVPLGDRFRIRLCRYLRAHDTPRSHTCLYA